MFCDEDCLKLVPESTQPGGFPSSTIVKNLTKTKKWSFTIRTKGTFRSISMSTPKRGPKYLTYIIARLSKKSSKLNIPHAPQILFVYCTLKIYESSCKIIKTLQSLRTYLFPFFSSPHCVFFTLGMNDLHSGSNYDYLYFIHAQNTNGDGWCPH